MIPFSEQQDFTAWEDSSHSWTYGALQDAVSKKKTDFKSNHKSDFQVLVVSDPDPFQIMLYYLAAWEIARPICVVPESWPTAWKTEVKERLDRFARDLPTDSFYLLPTSGSSGHPKLVIVTRKNFQAFFNAVLPLYRWAPGTRVALTFQSHFDPFLAMIFLTLHQGATLVPLPENRRFNIQSFVSEKKIDVWASVPSLVGLNRIETNTSHFSHLKFSLFTGEGLSAGLVKKWREVATHSVIDNLYGPVETTVWVTQFRIDSVSSMEKIPIGRPLAGVSLSLRDSELVVSGPQVAHGYLTPAGVIAFHGTYSTGDLAHDKDGSFYLDGRRDFQTKILGERVELEAIESMAFAISGEFCLAAVNSLQQICLVFESKIEVKRLSAELSQRIPKSHWPRKYYQIPKFPLLESGKVSRKEVLKLLAGGVLNELS